MSANQAARTPDAPSLAARIRAARPMALAVAFALLAIGVSVTLRREELGLFADVLRLLLVTSVATALVGAWLMLRRMAMMADAIAHSILLGIVVMFFFVSDPGSPLFVVGAAGAGLLTVLVTEALLGTRLVREDAAIGMTFPLLFALALVIIALAFRDAHVDEHLVLAGGVEITVLRRVVVQDWTLPAWLATSVGGLVQAIAPAEAVTVTQAGRMTIDGWNLGPRALWTMGGVLAFNVAFVSLLWKELKLTTFDAGLALSLGFAPLVLNYALMALVSVTAVAAFEAVGSILVIALFVGPPAIAYLLTDELGELMALTVLLALGSAWLGFLFGRAVGANFGGSVATVVGVFFIAALLLAPDQGLVARALRRRRQRRDFAEDLLLIHLSHHEGTPAEAEESALAGLPEHLRWSPRRAERLVARLQERGQLRLVAGQVRLTDAGRDRARAALRQG